MRRAIFVRRKFFQRRPQPKHGRVDLAPVCLPQHPSGDDVPEKNGRTGKRNVSEKFS